MKCPNCSSREFMTDTVYGETLFSCLDCGCHWNDLSSELTCKPGIPIYLLVHIDSGRVLAVCNSLLSAKIRKSNHFAKATYKILKVTGTEEVEV